MNSRSKAKKSNPGTFRSIIAMLLSMLLVVGPYGSLLPQAQAESTPPVQTADVDAAFFHRGENVSYFFKGNQYYRLTGTNVDPGYPMNLPGEWKGLPASFHSGIDAAVQDPYSNGIYFFKGNEYAAINPANKTVHPGYSQVKLPGGWQGLPASFASGIDAALDDNGSVILYKGKRQVVITNEKFVSETDIPASVLAVGPISAAFKYSNGRNYFFSGSKVARAVGFTVEPRWPNETKDVWIGLKSGSAPATRIVNPNSTKVTEVAFGPQAGERGLFRQVGDVNWQFRTGGRPNDKLTAECTETSRGVYQILLSCANNAYQFEINLSNRNVTKITGSQRTFADQVRTTDTFAIIADKDLKDPFKIFTIVKINQWIAKETSNSRIPFCYKNSNGRGVGTPLTTCRPGTEKNGALCYPLCRAGFSGNGPVCWGTCPSGFNDIGAFCQKAGDYTREGYGWQIGDPLLPDYSGPIGRCETKYGKGNCEQNGAVIYPKCKLGYKTTVVTICAPTCPDGWADTGTGCTKPSYGRGVGESMNCAAPLENSGGLCYQKCVGDFEGVGPVCWQNCRGRQPYQCGVGCAEDVNACAQSISDMVFSPIMLVLGIFTMGISARAQAAAKGTTKAITEGAKGTGVIFKGGVAVAQYALEDSPKWQKLFAGLSKLNALQKAEKITNNAVATYNIAATVPGLVEEIKLWADEYEENFAQNTSPEIEYKIRSQFDYNTQRYIKRSWAVHHLGAILEADQWRIGKLVTSVLGAAVVVDPGFISTVNAFAQPMCPTADGNPFPKDDGMPPPNWRLR